MDDVRLAFAADTALNANTAARPTEFVEGDGRIPAQTERRKKVAANKSTAGRQSDATHPRNRSRRASPAT
jgi:hypothetical protein